MTYDELNRFICHYLEKDLTGRALMLTGPWGTGKSYYIRNSLIPYLASSENGEHQCVVVSLFGLTNLSELSKAIYFEARIKKLQPKTEKGQTAIFAAKTVAKGVASFFGIDLSKNEEEFQKLFESIDLSGRLLILEDVERTSISLVELLGYISNLAEQDGVKVLLVTNEEAIIKYKPLKAEDDTESKKAPRTHPGMKDKPIIREYTDETLCYLGIKEKSIGDTIIFPGNMISAIKEIISMFSDKGMQAFSNDQCADDVLCILYMMGSRNLRSVIFACQKTADIFETIQKTGSYSEDFLKTVFYGIVSFSLRLHAGAKPKWTGVEDYSQELGINHFPLFRFCFDYITEQHIDLDKVPIAAKSLEQFRLYDKSKTSNDPDIIALNQFYLLPEHNVIETVNRVISRLANPADFSFNDYTRIALALICIKHAIGIDIETAKDRLVANLRGRGSQLSAHELFWYVSDRDSPEQQQEFLELRDQMISALAVDESIAPGFNYEPEQAKLFHDHIVQNTAFFTERRTFANHLDIPRLANMFVHCSASQMNDIRNAFLAVYRPSNIGEFLSEDAEAISSLLHELETAEQTDGLDKIQRFQCGMFRDNLIDFLNKLGVIQ